MRVAVVSDVPRDDGVRVALAPEGGLVRLGRRLRGAPDLCSSFVGMRQKRKGSCGTYVVVSLADLLDLGLIQLAARSIVCETSAGKAVPTDLLVKRQKQVCRQ